MKVKEIKRARNQRLKYTEFKHLRLDCLRAELSRARIKLDKTNAAYERSKRKRIQYDYRIEPRSTELGGGFQLYLFKNGIDVGGGVYADDFDALYDAVSWCNSRFEYPALDDAIYWFGFAEYRLNEAINRQNNTTTSVPSFIDDFVEYQYKLSFKLSTD